MTNDELKAVKDREERQRKAQIPVQALIKSGRYTEALAAIKARFGGEDQTAVPERFPFYLETWLDKAFNGGGEPTARAAFIRDLVGMEPNVAAHAEALLRTANSHGVRTDVFPVLVAILGADLNREFSLYVTPGLNLSTRQGSPSQFMQGPLWLVLLLCVCRPNEARSFGVLAHKRAFTKDDLAWIDEAASLAAKHGADLGLTRTVTWKRSKPVLQAMVSDIEARHLRQALDADQMEEPVRARSRL
ncbi:hypothetical protein [Paraburkholderia sp. BL21I4N1]|uniref:hypothetical protein n=1 Tax=Paraburkholderia sp. BL21I4N1 TaxID=1938801 RepID=UPI000CFD635F|nr:hypothetical protein [Paraburkholderia sp. BL21I4N1]PQV53435.1 hypothetical protein B0G83_102521 [Paraburkholderia sp. BL21I4N1]